MENQEMIGTEIVSGVSNSDNSGMKAAFVVMGVGAVLGTLLWNRVCKPVGKRIASTLKDKKVLKSKAAEDEVKPGEYTVE